MTDSGGLPRPSEPTEAAGGPPRGAAPPAPALKGFTVLERIFVGGQGSVWRAEQVFPKREVALKFPRQGPGVSPRAMARFKLEVELAARLKHPNIATVYEGNVVGGVPYYAMEFIRGRHLDAYVEAKSLGRRGTLELMRTVARAVQHAHQNGVIHRDLKPSNILVDDEGVPHILDFGLAKAYLEDDGGLESSLHGRAIGTPGWMSAEQARGETPTLDTRSDVYSLGLILLRLLLGPRAEPGDLDGAARGRGGLDGELRALLRKALATDREQRYSMAGELARDIDNYLAGDPLAARPARPGYVLRLWLWKHRRLAAAVGAVVVAAVVAVAFAIIGARAIRQRRAAEADAARQRYLSSVHLAAIRHEHGDAAEVARLLALCPGPLRGWEWHYLDGIRDQSVRAIAADAQGLFQVAVSPDGNAVLSCGKDGTATLWDARSGELLYRFTGHEGHVYAAAFSPDGRRVATAGADGTVRAWPGRGGAALWTVSPGQRAVESVAFSPDGNAVACAARDGTVSVYAAADGSALARHASHSGQATAVAVRRRAPELASAGTDGVIVFRDLRTGRATAALRGHAGTIYSLAFSGDGSRLVSAGDDRTVRLWDAEAMTELRILRGHTASATSAVFTPDGNSVVSAGWDRLVRLWDARSGAALAVLHGHEGYISSVAVFPRGGRIVSGGLDGTVRLWDPAASQPFRVLARTGDLRPTAAFTPDGAGVLLAEAQSGLRLLDAATGTERRALRPAAGDANRPGAFAVATTRDGRRAASAGTDGHVRLWNIAAGAELRDLACHKGVALSVAISPDGGRVISGGEDANACIWSLAGGGVRIVVGHGGPVYAVAIGPAGRFAATGCKDGTVRVVRLDDGRIVNAFTGHRGAVHCVAFSPDGRLVASAGADWTVRLWPLAAGGRSLLLAGHARPVSSVAFSPDGGRLVSAAEDGAVALWDPHTGARTFSLSTGGQVVWSACFSPDGRGVLAACADGTIRLWRYNR